MLIRIRPLYKVRMRQDQARTRALDTHGTITQQSVAILKPTTRRFKTRGNYSLLRSYFIQFSLVTL